MAENDKTHLYGDDTNNKTGIYNSSDNNKTGIYSSSENKGNKTSQGINAGDILRLKAKDYTVLKVISEGTGEANVYQITDPTGQKLALKLYYEFKSDTEEPNGLALERIQKLNDPDILRLYDFGIGEDKYNGKHCFEISDFAEGGNILEVADFRKKYSPKFIEENIIPQLYLAITRLHEFKIYHCDLKPGNILYKDKEQTDLILGDYGSAKAYDLKSEKALRKSTTIKGTEIYLPPEQARGIVSEKNDYYSFGMVLLHLLYPESLTSDNICREIDKDKFEQMVERQYNLKPVIDFNPKFKRLNALIEGLTLVNHINRWGSDEIEKWLKGENLKVSYRTKGASDIKPLTIGPVEISNAEEFIAYIESKQTWFQDLFEDPEVFRLIKDWLDNYIGIPDRKRFEKVVSIYKISGKLLLQAAVTMFLLPQRPLKVESQLFDFYNSENISITVTDYIAKIDSIYKFTNIELLSQYFFQLEYSLKALHYLNPENQTIVALLSKLYNPLTSKTKLTEEFDFKTFIPAHINPAKGQQNYEYMIWAFNAFNKGRPYPDNDNKPIELAEDLAVFYMKNKKLYDDKYHTFERNALLISFNLNKYANTSLSELVGNTLSKYAETIISIDYISFDKLCNVHYSVVSVLSSYLKVYGIDDIISFNEKKGFIYAEQNIGSAGKAANAFLEYLKDKHKDANFSPESLENLRTSFIKEHKKYNLMNNVVMVVATILIVVMVVAIILRLAN
jgi:serine/threonine protein kinase